MAIQPSNGQPSNRRSGESGYILTLVLFAILALSIAGAGSIYLAAAQASMAGDFRRHQTLTQCANAGAMTAFALANYTGGTAVTGASFSAGSGYVTQLGHYGSTYGTVSNTANGAFNNLSSGTAAADGALANFVALGYAGNDDTSVVRPGGLGSGLWRAVSTCQGPNGDQLEVENALYVNF